MDWSERHFGTAAAGRYAALIDHTVLDLRDNPDCVGAVARGEIGAHISTYHLKYSRDNVRGERVKQPRHFILYRYTDSFIEFARLLHDSRDLERHLPASYKVT
jgi:toxin ParE1/3/4